MHLDDEQIQRVVHGELTPASASTREHLEDCIECRSRVQDEAREERRIFALLGAIDVPAPQVSLASIMPGARPSRPWWTARVAAMVLGLVGAGIAYAAPGSPLPAFLRHLVAGSAPTPRRLPPGPRPPEVKTVSGISVAPGARFSIDLTPGEVSGAATVSLWDGDEVVVRAIGGSPRYSSDIGRLVVRNAKDVSALQIEIPRTAPWVEIRAGDRRLFRKTGSTIVSRGTRDASGRYSMTF
jgi:hypothetical protein